MKNRASRMLFLVLVAAKTTVEGSSSMSQTPPCVYAQEINYIGRLKTTEGMVYDVNNISISGALKDIPFYKMPSSDKSPILDAEFIDLAIVKKIIRPSDTIYRFNGKKYSAVHIVYESGFEDDYLIEISKEIFCIRVKTGNRKKVSFELLDFLTIEKSERRDFIQAESSLR